MESGRLTSSSSAQARFQARCRPCASSTEIEATLDSSRDRRQRGTAWSEVVAGSLHDAQGRRYQLPVQLDYLRVQRLEWRYQLKVPWPPLSQERAIGREESNP